MDKKKELTSEEIKQQYEEAKKVFEELGVQLRIAQQKEEEQRKAKLALEKENRKKEVDKAFEKYNTLVKAYIKDYGSYTTITSTNDYNWWPNSFWRSFF